MKLERELKYFDLLKKEVISHFREDFSYVSEDPTEWKITHINYFQEHLFQKTKGNFSDRWFYTYFKNNPNKLPRIDMLNILSNYIGYKSWGDYVSKNPIEEEPWGVSNENISEKNEELTLLPIESKPSENSVRSVEKALDKKITTSAQKRKKLIIPSSLIVLLGGFLLISYINKKNNTYRFYFKDNDRGSKMKGIRVYIPSNAAEPILVSDSLGGVSVFTKEDTIRMYIQSPFYRKDTFLINLSKSDGEETIELTPNEYALMMYYYSRSDKSGPERRRSELNRLITDDALIYQVYDNEDYGVEVLSKDQYINLMTTPTESLKNFVLLSTSESGGKITHIKFKINS